MMSCQSTDLLRSTVASRRKFLQAAGTASCLGYLTAIESPLWAYAQQQASLSTDHILVVIQLSGGNDGLNTVIPVGDDLYHKNRPLLAYPSNNVLNIDDYLGWHPSARGLADLFEAGELAVIQGVGYPNPNRSHFESMDLWHTAHASSRVTGWLGRYADECAASLVYVGQGSRPLALESRQSLPLTVRQLEQFRLNDDRMKQAAAALSQQQAADDLLLANVAESLQLALKADEKLASAMTSRTGNPYPATELGGDLRSVATMIRSGFGSRVYYVTLDGFDTHANQRDAHAVLLSQLGEALQSFRNELVQDGLWQQVAVLTFSEFGRRVAENGSQGTDHGVAGPVFVAGGAVQGGVIGAHPSLSDLDEGDLRHHIDYRQVYASLLRDWLNVNPQGVLGGDFEPVEKIFG